MKPTDAAWARKKVRALVAKLRQLLRDGVVL
jgi:hypothetical protein